MLVSEKAVNIFSACCNAIALMKEAVSTSETSANIYQTTRRNIVEDSHLHTRRRESPASSVVLLIGCCAQ
jgi:hypothetical protein